MAYCMAQHILRLSEKMLEFGLPLDLIMKFIEKSAGMHGLPPKKLGKVKDRILSEVNPKFVFLQPVGESACFDLAFFPVGWALFLLLLLLLLL